jgi:hypothetical protein
MIAKHLDGVELHLKSHSRGEGCRTIFARVFDNVPEENFINQSAF